MTAPNHIAGGLFFAGFWTSFWNINIFQKPQYIAVAIVSSLLADIDHSRSAIGLAFFPISNWLDKKYGHRTITHSLSFLIAATFTVLIIERNLLSEDWNGITVIFFFGFLSHLVIDMITIAGVPLLYPFRRNPCVIPGRSEYRVRTGNKRSEIVGFLVFCSLNFLCIDLYRQGFWFTYNNTFTTIEHVHYERANSPNFTLCRYYFIQQGNAFRGIAPIIDSKETSLDLLINGKINRLDYTTPGLVLKEVRPVKTRFTFRYITRAFINDSLVALNNFCRDRIISGIVQSETPFIVHFFKPDDKDREETKSTSSVEFLNATALVFSSPPPQADTKAAILKQIAIKKQTLIQDKINFQKSHVEYYDLKRQERELRNQLASTSDNSIGIGERNSLENELIRIKNKLQFLPAPVYTENTVTLETIRQLYIQLNQPAPPRQYLNATLSYLAIPDTLLHISKRTFR